VHTHNWWASYYILNVLIPPPYPYHIGYHLLEMARSVRTCLRMQHVQVSTTDIRDMTWHHFDGTVLVEVSKTLLAWLNRDVSLQSFHLDSFGRQTSTATVNYCAACHTCKTTWVTLCRHWRKSFVGPRRKWDSLITQHFFSTAVHTSAFIYLHTLQVICNILLDLNVVPHGCSPVCSTRNWE